MNAMHSMTHSRLLLDEALLATLRQLYSDGMDFRYPDRVIRAAWKAGVSDDDVARLEAIQFSGKWYRLWATVTGDAV